MYKAFLLLADGSIFKGVSIGTSGVVVGEVVFNTSMTGYQEILTDPSYSGQLVTLTYPHIGNTGINTEDNESIDNYLEGLIIRDSSIIYSNFRSSISLSEYLSKKNTVAIAEIDTRRLTNLIRERGSQVGCIVTNNQISIEAARAKIIDYGSMNGKDLAGAVSCKSIYNWTQKLWNIETHYTNCDNYKYHIVVYDFGVKFNILRYFSERNCKVTVVPAKTPFDKVLALKPTGIFLSNGPGDPEPCNYAIDNIKLLLEEKIPIFGICLGHQLLALALGGKTKKMKFGHHGANHPVIDLESNRVLITSQNHNFEVDSETLPSNVKLTHKSLFDGSLQGFELKDKPIFSFQGHPEASPGPHDIGYLFDKFIKLMDINSQ